MAILTKAGVAFDVSPFPKLKALHGAMRADPALALYFASDMYKRSVPGPVLLYVHLQCRCTRCTCTCRSCVSE
jgi:hypothetical protein